MKIKEQKTETKIDRFDGSLRMFRKFEVQRNEKSESHVVTVEISHSGTPQHEKCDCKGYQFKHHCSHIDAVYNAKLLCVYADEL